MSEAEYIATIRMAGELFHRFIDEVSRNRGADPLVQPADADGADADGADTKIPEGAYWTPADLHTVEFDSRYGDDRPDGPDVARGETDDRGLAPQEEAPLPKAAQFRGQDLDRGRKAFEKLLRLWIKNFGVADAEQPDRAEAMRTLANSPKSFRVLAYVKSQGGLTYAVNALLADIAPLTVADGVYQQTVLDVAGNLTQVASILFPDLSDLYEYKNIFRSGEDEEDEDDE
jgi:hypothetical protein